jgi:Zn-dependent peptidase ImmA (M78 family)
MSYDWSGITSSAYLTLIELDLQEFPIPAEKIKCKGVKIASYKSYAEKTGRTIEEITLGNELEDAFVLKGLRSELTLILYDDSKYGARMKHTLWHEIGHIKRNHQRHGENEEVEAHYFASQANAPNAVIKAIADRGYSIDVTFLMECFGVSGEAAKKKMDYLGKYSYGHANEYDDLLRIQFKNHIDTKYPTKNTRHYDNYFDEMERERAKW